MKWNTSSKKIFAPLAAVALAACATVGDTDTVTDGSDVRLGQTAYVDGPQIRPVEVIEDSRCPMNARCVWAGRVRLKALWIRSSGNQEIELTLGEPTPVADGALTLTSVRPDKTTDQTIAPKDYRFSFSFAGGI